jgi:hexosaminidase
MKRFFTIAASLSLSLVATAQSQPSSIAIIPAPVSVQKTAGEYQLPTHVYLDAGNSTTLSTAVTLLKEKLTVSTGYTVSNGAGPGAIQLKLNKQAEESLGTEGYRLSVKPQSVVITANTPAGVFYGVQTLLQLFPKEIGSPSKVSARWTAPCVDIMDYPRFKWRGLMFDVARHFFGKQDVEQFIDQMVQYKFNLLHLHLTDDEGWRIQIKSFPKLTTVGAYNVKKVGYFGTFSAPTPDEPRNYGGFFTQQDIRDIVAYAKNRFVDILPEIDVPGHSLAAVASYPELSCTPGADNYHVRSGEEIMDWSHGAPPIALLDNTLCPANEKVYDFLDKVLTEVAALFPFEYIHMGGDECPKNFWEKSDAVKALMQKEHLKDMQEVQSYFEKRLEKIVESKGKKFMGWDEILEGGLAPNAAVMSWRGIKGGIEAAKQGHEVVMSPTTFAYIDYMNGDPIIEPRIYASLLLSKAYQFEPVPEGVDPKYIKGGQANLWSEQLYNMRHVEYMTWPRGWAIAESVWSPKAKKNWNDFYSRTEQHFERSDIAKIKYAPSVFDPIFTFKKSGDSSFTAEMKTEGKDLDIYYTWDNSFPDNFYPKYTTPLNPPKDAVQLRVVTYKGDKQMGRILTFPVPEMKRRAEKNDNYPRE